MWKVRVLTLYPESDFRNELKYKSELERQSVHISELEISLKTLELNGAKYKDKLTDLEVKLAEKHEEVLQLSKQLESSKHMVSTVNSELSSLQAQVNWVFSKCLFI